jgi:hypothetical protein
VQTAITHYISGGLPALAVQCIIRHAWERHLSVDVLESILAKLKSSDLHESAGELYEHLRRYSDAVNAYRQCVLLPEDPYPIA